MNTRASKTPPNPSAYKDLRGWAAAMVDYMAWSTDIRRPVEPRAYLLAHRLNVPDSNVGVERAAADGIIMFDPTTGEPVYAEGGAWLPFWDKALGTALQTGTAAITAATETVTFPTAFSAPPVVVVTPVGIGADNETVNAEVDNVTAAGFDVRLTMVDSAFSAPVRPVSGTINWMAQRTA